MVGHFATKKFIGRSENVTGGGNWGGTWKGRKIKLVLLDPTLPRDRKDPSVFVTRLATAPLQIAPSPRLLV
jgi:hypothetical protein